MNNKAFTLIEVLVVTAIALILLLIVFTIGASTSDNYTINPVLNPQAARAQAAQRQVEATNKQNRLMQQLLREKAKEPHK